MRRGEAVDGGKGLKSLPFLLLLLLYAIPWIAVLIYFISNYFHSSVLLFIARNPRFHFLCRRVTLLITRRDFPSG